MTLGGLERERAIAERRGAPDASSRRRIRTPAGWLEVHGRERELALRAGAVALGLAASAAPAGQWIALEGIRAWFKGDALTGKARVRHGLRRHLLRRPLPRICELQNLEWLRERLFQAPAPLAAGVLYRRGLPRYQFLVTAEIAGAITLREFLESGAPGRSEVLEELAREVARMHALRFVHRDLYPRNLLVGPREHLRRVHFIDAWRGGRRLQLRGPAHDLGCFYLGAPGLLSRAEQQDFFARYLEERRAQGRPARRLLARAVERRRAALVRRLARRPELCRGRPLPPLDWALDPPPRRELRPRP